MFLTKTVFVIGAGASCDLNLPAGDGLRGILVNLLQREQSNCRFVSEYVTTAVHQLCAVPSGNGLTDHFEEYARAAMQMRMGLPLAISIDNYLHAHRKDDTVRTLGKIAIATAILDAERNSHLRTDSVTQIGGIDRYKQNEGLEKSWYLPLMRLLTAGKSVEDLDTLFRNVAFVVFNYDRCLEQFLVNAVMAYFSVPANQAIECVLRLKIIHPYGRVGYLSWQNQPLTAQFGNPNTDLTRIAEGIQTFTESQDVGIVQEVKDLVCQAETLVFMGYGFLDQNNEMLTTQKTNTRRVFATTDGISDNDVPIIKEKIANIIGKRQPTGILEQNGKHWAEVFIERGRCRNLMDNNRFRLAQKLPALID